MKLGYRLDRAILFLLLGVLLAIPAMAQSNPPGCSATGVGLSLSAYRSDGVTPIPGGDVVEGEVILYQATLSYLGSPNCFFEGGTLTIEVPNGTVYDVTPIGGIPTITNTTSFTSGFVNYTVSLADISLLPGHENENHIVATARYENGTSLLADGISPVSASTPIEIHVLLESLNVSKNALPLVGRLITWNITKEVDPASHDLTGNLTGNSTYNITVTKLISEGNFSVEGNITIVNPSEFSNATLLSVEDTLGNISADVDCGVTFPYDLAPEGTLVCSYTADLPDNTTRTNFVNVSTEGIVSGGNATAEVDFANALFTDEGFDDITVDDTNNQTFNFSGSDSVTYPYLFTCNNLNFTNGTASYVHNNTATILETNQSDTAQVTVVCRQVEEGCTRTQGYWKTHSELGPAPYDSTWALLPQGANTTFFLSNKTYYQVFQTPVAGNAYYNLAHQYIAAQLNQLANATAPANVTSAFNNATTLFNTYTPAQIGALKGNNALRQQFISLAGLLGSFNEGLIGPGHCEE